MSPIHRVFLFLVVLILAFSSEPAASAEQASNPASTTDSTKSSQMNSTELEAEIGFNVYDEQWTGDLDEMESQRLIRVLTVYGLGRYFLDGGRQKGATYDLFKAFEDFVNERMGKGHLRVHVVFIPVARDVLLSSLIEGRGDIAAAGLTITPEREALVDFTRPVT